MTERQADDAAVMTDDTPSPYAPPPAIVPEWLANLAALGWRVLVITALVVVAWLLATALWTVTASIAVAVVISAFFAPYALRLRKRGRSRAVSAAIVWVVALAVVGGALVLLGLALFPYADDLIVAISNGVSAAQADFAALGLPPAVSDVLKDVLSFVVSLSGGLVGQIVNSAAAAITIIVLAAFLVFFFLKDGDKAWVWIFQAASDQKRDRITAAGDDALWRVGGYLRGTTYLSAIIAITDYVFMVVLGVPLAAPLALLAFLSGYIPYFGGAVATLIILVVAYSAVGSGAVIALLVLIAIRNMILGYGVRPAIYGRSVSIHPAVVLLALPVGFELGGVVGLFAAVPATAIMLAVASATVAILDPGPQPGLPALVPGWIDRAAQWSWRLLVGVGLITLFVAIFVSMPLLVIPLLLALILAATLDPLLHRLMAGGRSRTLAAAIAVGGTFLVVVGVLAITVVALVGNADDVTAAANAGAQSVDAATGGRLGLLRHAVSIGGTSGVHAVAATAQAAGQVAVIVILSVLLAFYFLKDGNDLWGRVLGRVRPDVAPEVDAAGNRAFNVLGGYMIGTGAISLVGAGSQLFIMLVLGIPLALPVFVLSFFLCFIPYIGGFISTGIALLLTIAVGTPVDIAVMVVWTLIFNIVTGNIVTPLVYGRMVHLHPAVVLVAIPGGAAVAGILGMFIVVPAMAVVAATWRTIFAVIGTRRRPTITTADAPGPPTPAPDTLAPSPEPA